jgi:hypothetical protein
MRKGIFLTVIFFIIAGTAGNTADLGHAPWPGMTAWDVAWCRDLVWKAGFVEIREPDQATKVVWIKDVRGWRKPNGFYGLKINLAAVDEATVWLSYQGRMTNLRVLLT